MAIVKLNDSGNVAALQDGGQFSPADSGGNNRSVLAFPLLLASTNDQTLATHSLGGQNFLHAEALSVLPIGASQIYTRAGHIPQSSIPGANSVYNVSLSGTVNSHGAFLATFANVDQNNPIAYSDHIGTSANDLPSHTVSVVEGQTIIYIPECNKGANITAPANAPNGDAWQELLNAPVGGGGLNSARVFMLEVTSDLTNYTFQATDNNSGLVIASDVWVLNEAPVDSTAPVLSSPSVSGVTTSTATPQVTTGEGNGTAYMVIVPNSDVPSAAQIKAGQQSSGAAAIASQNLPVNASGVINFSGVTGLTPSTDYEAYFVQTDTSGNDSASVTIGFRTSDPDTTAPILSGPNASAIGQEAVTPQVTTDEGNGVVYMVLVPDNDIPSVAQIKSGLQSNGSAAISAENIAAVSAGQITFAEITGLSPSTNYDIYFVHTDSAGNDSGTSSIGFTTNAIVPAILTVDAAVPFGGTINFTTQGLNALNSWTLSDGTNTINLSSGNDTSAVIPALGNNVNRILSGNVTLTVGDGTNTASTSTTLNPPSGYSSVLLQAGFSTDSDSYLFGYTGTPEVGDEFFYRPVDFNIFDGLGGWETVGAGSFTFYGTDATDGVMQSTQLVVGGEPVITLNGNIAETVTVNTPYTDAGATAADPEDGDITADIVVTGVVDTTTIGTYTLRYNVSDSEGNAAKEVTRTVEVVAIVDTVRPVITLVGNPTVTVVQGNAYVDAGATASDDVDGDITANIISNNPVDVNVVGAYEVTYDVADAAGNAALRVTRAVNVVASLPSNPPVITLLGNSQINVPYGSQYIDDGATATDDNDGDISANIVVTNPVDTSVPGTYTIRYNVTDSDNLAANEVTRTVLVLAAPTGDDSDSLVQDWVDDIRIEVPEPTDRTIARFVRFSIQEFFRRSEAWKHEFTFTISKGTNRYAVALPAETKILALKYAYYIAPNSSEKRRLKSTIKDRVNTEAKGVTREVYATRTHIVINPADEDGDIEYGVVLLPSKDINIVPADYADAWWEYIRAGALAKLLSQPGKEWTDKRAAMEYRLEFMEGIKIAKREARQDRSRPDRRVRFNKGFRW